MGEVTSIAWTHHTFNAWIGCAKVSAGCKNCYAEVETFARRSRANGIELWGENASRHVTSDAYWKDPLAWNRAAEKDRERRRVFCSSMSDVFEDRKDLDLPRARLWKLISETPWLDWLLLTKRPENAVRLWTMAAIAAQELDSKKDAPVWQPNVWLGMTAEDQERANERIPHLLRVPAAVRFLSCEPLLGPVDLTRFFDAWAVKGETRLEPARRPNWVIGGGESGPGARPCDIAWLRSLRDQCKDAGVPYFNKQLGTRPEMSPGPISWPCTHPKGGDPEEWPEDLRVREFPRPMEAR